MTPCTIGDEDPNYLNVNENSPRDGYCRTDDNDHGIHVVCATMTENFLAFTKSRGNDLSSARGGFPGLRPGDRWCLCAARWREAMLAGAAPLVLLSSSHIKERIINIENCPFSQTLTSLDRNSWNCFYI